MKKPKYISELLSFIFLLLAALFLLFGTLCFFGLFTPSSHSLIQSKSITAILFSALGGAFLLTALVCFSVSRMQNKIRRTLLSEGVRITGKVQRIKHITSVSFGKQSPYRILYSYIKDGHTVYQKSHLLWDKPHFTQEDTINIYIDDSGHTALEA